MQLKSALGTQKDVWRQVVFLLEKRRQCVPNMLLLALRSLCKAPPKAIVAMRERNQEFVANFLTEDLLDLWQQNSNGSEVVVLCVNPSLSPAGRLANANLG